MLRLRSFAAVTHFLSSSPYASLGSSLHRLLSAAAFSANPRFAVEDYLVETCGLTLAQVLKASAKLSHLKSPTNPDAVVAFLSGGLGLSSADIAAVVAKDPKFLCASVKKTLAPVAAGLTDLGLSRAEVATIASSAPCYFRTRSNVANLKNYYLPLLGSSENLLLALKKNSRFFSSDLERVVKPTVAFLREHGFSDREIVKALVSRSRMFAAKPERFRAMAAWVDQGLGVPCGSGMFKHILLAAARLGVEKAVAKMEHLKDTLRWSDTEASLAVCKAPLVLWISKDLLQRKSEFLILEVGLEPAYIARRPVLLSYSLEGRLRPRYYVVKFLEENGLLDRGRDYYSKVMISEKVFMEKFICPHKVAAPHIAEDYAAARRGEVPARFR
ncbi:uncharacterized protein LOC100833278 [Brachypodium distachyon]|nr:uncharacterized protein LOC100833278 [Brachypodium distachyon]|eukprot:XP_003570800.1 uncharacterized protein LOC100833278 [Brachypodium distachyon]